MLVLLLACTAPSGDDSGAPPASAPSELSVLSYNVHGLPPEITGDDTAARLAAIGPMLAEWDLAGIQEDWIVENHDVLVAAAGQPTREWFSDVLDDRVYGAGTTQLTVLAENAYFEQHYTQCNGTLDGASDCFASKGFQVLRLALAEGLELDWYNTHFEAGGGEADDTARAAGVAEILASMDERSAGRAILFTGDTNLNLDDPEDVPLLDQIAQAGLRDACTEVGCDEPDHIDRIFVRDGGGVALSFVGWNREADFVDADGVDLSDHPAISARISWAPE